MAMLYMSTELVFDEKLTTDFWKRQYVYNVFSHNSPIVQDTLYNEEEMKLIKDHEGELSNDFNYIIYNSKNKSTIYPTTC